MFVRHNCSQLQANAKRAALPGTDPLRKGMPIAGRKGKAKVPDARRDQPRSA